MSAVTTTRSVGESGMAVSVDRGVRNGKPGNSAVRDKPDYRA